MFNGNYIIKLNFRCNANCLFCADSKIVRSKLDPDFEQCLEELETKRKEFDSIIISGGEPSIHRQLFPYLEEVQKLKYRRVMLVTNGFLLSYPDFVRKLSDYGVTHYQVSFQTTRPQDYHTITGVKRAYEYVVKALENIKMHGGIIHINTCVHKLNYTRIPELVRYLNEIGVERIQLSFLNPIGSSMLNGGSLMAISFTEALPYLIQAVESSKVTLDLENIPLCIIPEFEKNISDFRKPEINKDYYNTCKTKPTKCRKCAIYNRCDGVWNAYLEQFGDRELNPEFHDK